VIVRTITRITLCVLKSIRENGASASEDVLKKRGRNKARWRAFAGSLQFFGRKTPRHHVSRGKRKEKNLGKEGGKGGVGPVRRCLVIISSSITGRFGKVGRGGSRGKGGEGRGRRADR